MRQFPCVQQTYPSTQRRVKILSLAFCVPHPHTYVSLKLIEIRAECFVSNEKFNSAFSVVYTHTFHQWNWSNSVCGHKMVYSSPCHSIHRAKRYPCDFLMHYLQSMNHYLFIWLWTFFCAHFSSRFFSSSRGCTFLQFQYGLSVFSEVKQNFYYFNTNELLLSSLFGSSNSLIFFSY